MTQVILTRIPSKLIRLALSDLRICESQPNKYKINMMFWYKQYKLCSVCLAGSVMANTTKWNFIDTDIDTYIEPMYDPENEDCYHFLDCIREVEDQQDMKWGCKYIDATPIPWDKEIPLYEDDKEGFHKALNELADAFEASGQ